MASVFWDAKGIVFIFPLKKCRTINGEYYANQLKQIKAKRPEKLKKNDVVPSGQCAMLCMTVASHFSTNLRIHRSISLSLFSVSEHEKAPSWEALPSRRGVDSC